MRYVIPVVDTVRLSVGLAPTTLPDHKDALPQSKLLLLPSLTAQVILASRIV
jgi:hypothetical protein